MNISYEGKVVAITGAASGMGRAGAEQFASAGARVICIDRDAEATAKVVESIRAIGGKADALVADMLDFDQVREVVAQLGDEVERLDVLWNHLGGPAPLGAEFDEEAMERGLRLNLSSPILMTRLAWPLLQASAPSSLLFTASVGGLVASINSPIYSAAKSGIIGFSRGMAAVGGPLGIRSNVICPGATDTPMLKDFFASDTEDAGIFQERVRNFVERVPMRRLGKPEEVGSLAVFLGSEHASYITGWAIPVDGGYVVV